MIEQFEQKTQADLWLFYYILKSVLIYQLNIIQIIDSVNIYKNKDVGIEYSFDQTSTQFHILNIRFIWMQLLTLLKIINYYSKRLCYLESS